MPVCCFFVMHLTATARLARFCKALYVLFALAVVWGRLTPCSIPLKSLHPASRELEQHPLKRRLRGRLKHSSGACLQHRLRRHQR